VSARDGLARPVEAGVLAKIGNMRSAASEHVIVLDGIAVIVNPQNPVFGGMDAKIAVHARDDKSGTYDSFKATVLRKTPLLASAVRYESSDKLSDAVAGDALAIGFVGLAYVRSAKPVMVRDATSLPLLPSPLTVATEDYPLARRLFLYAPSAVSENAKSFIDFVTSDEGQAIVRRTGFVDLQPECDARAQKCVSCTPDYAPRSGALVGSR
jgi:phosphate transport system substrate-binding protein